jgi:penicillin-binding protein 1C
LANCLLFLLLITAPAYALTSFQEVKDSYKKSDAVLLDRHGKVIHELRIDDKVRRLEWTSLKDISPALIQAVIFSEDKRFYKHSGVDFWAVGSAAFKNIFSESQRGASTITMQLAAMLNNKLRPKSPKRALYEKLEQVMAAREIEKSWSKQEILEAYLNLIFFRGEIQGISATSRGLFEKEPNGLNESESAILASLIRSPNAHADDVAKRACALKLQINCEDIKLAAQRALSTPYSIKQQIALAPHVAHQLLKKDGGKIASTLDAMLQKYATEALQQQLRQMEDQNVHDGAILVVENKSGNVLAYVANSGQYSSARYVDGIKAKRQAGSTLKPFLYAIAFEKKILTPASVLNDQPLDIATPLGIYKPQNYENAYKGMVSARTALASSLNIPAVKTLSLIGVESFIQRLRQMGFSQIESDEYYGLSLALGSADVSLWEMTNAYRMLANNGVWSDLRLRFENHEERSNRVFSKDAVFLASSILSDRAARGATFGFENPLSTRFWTAVKTGTSKDMRDNWCIGYSDRYTVGVWVGNFSGKPMWDVSGISGAAPVWLEIMNYLHSNTTSIPQSPPSELIMKKIKFQDEIEPERSEWFIKGTEPSGLIANETHIYFNKTTVNFRITYPLDDTIIALDPDIPEEQQLLFFEAEADGVEFDWLLNSENIEGSKTMSAWKPGKGRYKLSLIDKQNTVIDTVKFEVR